MNAWLREADWRTGLIAGLLVANGLVLWLLVLPAYEAHLRHAGQVLALDGRIRTLQREGRSSEVLLTAFHEVEEFWRGYPGRAALVSLMGQLTELARSQSLDVPEVSYRPADVKEASLTKVTIQMGVQGPYGKIRRYLYELEGMRRHLVIERLSLREQRGSADLQVQVQLALYLQ
jgi:hypothetical protein